MNGCTGCGTEYRCGALLGGWRLQYLRHVLSCRGRVQRATRAGQRATRCETEAQTSNRFHVIREEVPCFLKYLHPAFQVRSGIELQKRTDESAREDVRFRDRLLALLRFRVCKDFISNLGYVQRERSMHSPAVRADMSKIAAFRRASLVKKNGVGVEKRK